MGVKEVFKCLFPHFLRSVSDIKLREMWPLLFDIFCNRKVKKSLVISFTAHLYQRWSLRLFKTCIRL